MLRQMSDGDSVTVVLDGEEHRFEGGATVRVEETRSADRAYRYMTLTIPLDPDEFPEKPPTG
jgi:hypothetical protein